MNYQNLAISNELPGAAVYFSNPDLYGAPPKPPVTIVKPSPSYIYTSDTDPNKNASNRIGRAGMSTRLGNITDNYS